MRGYIIGSGWKDYQETGSGDLYDYVDLESGASITYTVTAVPGHGQLELSAAPGVVITSFTQAQLDAGEVVYVARTDREFAVSG